jgi:hypothetical protein
MIRCHLARMMGEHKVKEAYTLSSYINKFERS